MKEYKLTLLGIVIAVLTLAITLGFHVDLFEIFIASFQTLEHFELDEIFIPLAIVFIFAFFDAGRRERARRVEAEKSKIYQAMLFSTHHILYNFLNQVQLVKLTAESTTEFDPKVLELYDRTIEDAKSQIKALSAVTELDETIIRQTILPKSDLGQ